MEFSSYAMLRRCGCGLAKLDVSDNLAFGASFNLPGDIQTVPRAEAFALVVLVRNMAPATDITYVTEHLGVHKIFTGGPTLVQTAIFSARFSASPWIRGLDYRLDGCPLT